MNSIPIEAKAGSLTWQVARLQLGESLIKDDTGEAIRRACSRAVAVVQAHVPERTYQMSVWYAVLSTGRGQALRMLKLQRVS